MLHTRHKRALRHLLVVELHTDVFHATEIGAGWSDPKFIVAGVGVFLSSVTAYFTMK